MARISGLREGSCPNLGPLQDPAIPTMGGKSSGSLALETALDFGGFEFRHE
jgi:hypothetical protein